MRRHHVTHPTDSVHGWFSISLFLTALLSATTMGMAGIPGMERPAVLQSFREVILLTGEQSLGYPAQYDLYFAGMWGALLGGIITYVHSSAYRECFLGVYRLVRGYFTSVVGALLFLGALSALLPGAHTASVVFTGVRLLIVVSLVLPMLYAVFECMYEAVHAQPARYSKTVAAGYSTFLTMVCMLYGSIVGLWYGMLLWCVCLFGFACLTSIARGIGYLLYVVTHSGLLLRRMH